MSKENLFINLSMIALCGCGLNEANIYLVTGSFTDETETGLNIFQFNQNTLEHRLIGQSKDVQNPTYMCVSDDKSHLWVTGTNKEPEDSVYTFSIDLNNGVLNKISSSKTGGGRPCYIVADKNEKFVATANYNGGNITFFDINVDKTLSDTKKTIDFYGHGIHPRRQKQPYLHSVVYSPDYSCMLAADLGRDMIYQLTQSIDGYMYVSDSIILKPGSGPRHICFSKNGSNAYVICELSGMVATLYKEGDRYEVEDYVAADLYAGESSADIHLSDNGKYLYASVRDANDGIAVYNVQNKKGIPVWVGYVKTGRHPRNFIITPNGKYILVACRNDNQIQIFKIMPDGLLEFTGRSIKCERPVCLKWIETN